MLEQSAKQKQIINYIRSVAEQLNKQYNGIMNKDRYNRAVEMFKDSELPYEEIVDQINQLAQQVVKNYIEEREKRFNPELVKKNHEEIYSKLEILVRKLNERGIDYQLAGALCAYIKYGVESSRTHDDIDIDLNEADMDKFRQVCEEMGLQFHDDRITTPRVLKNGIPAGDHEVLATLDGSDFHIGAFCFERKSDGTIVNKGYYHDEKGQVYTRDDVMSPELAQEIFGREQVDFRGQKLTITPPEYVYRLKNYTKKDKDLADIEFMEDRIDKEKLEKISELSKTSRVEHTRVKVFSQNFNYHTHTYRSGHGEYCTDEEMLLSAKQNGITMLGFSEHIPNPDLVLPDEDHRMLFSEVENYISSINRLKQEHPEMTILSGFEVEFDPMRESFFGEMREKVDYMILGQHFVPRGLNQVNGNANPNYPIEYANMVAKAIDSGLFDIVAHPDIFMEFRDTMTDEQSRQLFDENSIIASQIICEKARDMGIPIEINFGSAEKNNILSDGNLAYPHPTFWKVASEIEGLQVLQGIDAHHQKAFEKANQCALLTSNITDMVKDKIIKNGYDPKVARQNNPKLQEAYRNRQEKALSFETHMVNQIMQGISSNIPNGLSTEDIVMSYGEGLNSTMQGCVENASRKDKSVVDEISMIADNPSDDIKQIKAKVERKKATMDETNKVLANQQRVIENAKGTVANAMNIGCETKEEFTNMTSQITQHNTTSQDSQKVQIEQHVSDFQSKKVESKTKDMGHAYQLKKVNNNSSGYINTIVLSLIVTFVIGLAVGIGYMLYKFSIGG